MEQKFLIFMKSDLPFFPLWIVFMVMSKNSSLSSRSWKFSLTLPFMLQFYALHWNMASVLSEEAVRFRVRFFWGFLEMTSYFHNNLLKILLPSLNSFYTFVKNQLAVFVGHCFWVLLFVSLTYVVPSTDTMSSVLLYTL